MADDEITIKVDTDDDGDGTTDLTQTIRVSGDADLLRGNIGFRAREPANRGTKDLFDAIRVHTEQISFPEFQAFVKQLFNRGAARRTGGTSASDMFRSQSTHRMQQSALEGPEFPDLELETCFFPGANLYKALRTAAEIFLLARCGTCRSDLAVGDAGSAQWWSYDVFGGAEVPERGAGETDSDYQDRLKKYREQLKKDQEALLERLTTFLGDDRRSYIRAIVHNAFDDQGFDLSPLSPLSAGLGPCLLELIWSYWMEEGMLVQSINAVALRFQNVRVGNGRDPLADLEIDSLRPLSGFLWGYIQDEPHRLSLVRRAHEYAHLYGLSLYGKAVPPIQAADVRSRFLQAFHDLLTLTARIYQEASDNTVTPDPFPLLVALRDLHLILAEGAHNQFRDLPWTARVEMLVQQWLLARPEMQDFLRGRRMVPYPESWMGTVDAMKKLQGWSDTNVIHFRDLAVFGERILLSIRYVAWNDITDPDAALDWALAWRAEVQGYIHAYRMVTGVSLSDEMVEVRNGNDLRYRQPSFHLRNRLRSEQHQRGRLGGGEAPRQLNPPAPQASSASVITTRTRA